MQQITLRGVVLRIGNVKRRDLVALLNRVWPEVRTLCERTTKRLIRITRTGLKPASGEVSETVPWTLRVRA